MPIADGCVGRVIRRCDDANVNGDLLRSANANHASALEDSQQLRLQVDRHLGDFVEEQRSSGGPLEIALVLAYRTGERSTFVPEQLGLDQIGGYRAAVHADERAVAPCAARVQQLRGDFLACTRFADEHDCRQRSCNPTDALHDFHHLGRLSDQGTYAVPRGRPRSARPTVAERRGKCRNRRRARRWRRACRRKVNKGNIATVEFVSHDHAPVFLVELP